MDRMAAFFAALVAVFVLLLLGTMDFGKLPFTTGRRLDCGDPPMEALHG
ncbi:hypothetical protein NUH86_01575 [Sphingobium sp. JS3065]|nr:hypothetical protein [Sphingobium sp. JS3065]UZW55520.1 hypothetical protein NUH86_01575 [Sphingobium sp. JS3065]